MNIEAAFRILGVEPEASFDEVRQAYRDLVTVWHPDRHANNPRLQSKAEVQLKQINLAYEAAAAFLKGREDRRRDEERRRPEEDINGHGTCCPRCGYERRPMDEVMFSKLECPKCGVVYSKFEAMQNRSNRRGKVVYMYARDGGRRSTEGADRPGRKKHPVGHAVLWGFTIGMFLILWHYRYPAETNFHGYTREHAAPGPVLPGGAAKIIPHEPNYGSLPSGPGYRRTARLARAGALEAGGGELLQKIAAVSRAYDHPLDDAYIYHNQVESYEWDTIKSLPKYAAVASILRNFHHQHRYMGRGFFVCLDMAVDVWNLLETAGIRARIMVGNVRRDIADESTVKKYLVNMNHAWVLAEVSPSVWVPVETTGGYIVDPSMRHFPLYNVGTMFENPEECKNFNVSRKAMFNTCNATVRMIGAFNRLYAGKPVTAEAIEYSGRMSQKLDDCSGLVERVTAFLRRR